MTNIDSTNKYKNVKYSNAASLLTFLPIIFMFTIVPGLQWGVGNDYFEYVSIIENVNLSKDRYQDEYLFFFIVKTINYFDFDAQLFFIISSFIVFFNFTILGNKLRKYGFDFSFVILSLIVVSTIYHSQMNITRQAIAASFLLISSLLFFESKFIKSIIVFFLAVGFHKTSVIVFPLFFILKIKIPKYAVLCIFAASVPIYLFFIPGMINIIVTDYYTSFSHYIYSHSPPGSIVNVLSKVYYFPLLMSSLLLSYKSNGVVDNLARAFNTLLACLFFSCLLILSSSIYARILFYIFPFVIFSISYLYVKSNDLVKLLILFYILLPYVIKVILLPSGEYTYQTYLF
ncbi:EpsG family protein [Vibrio harveyi]|uniref:EpsG family protein n=1 Tax=Vibrio harveyi TaxID=669 RepID=UPI00237FE231|nr:EpsG family protein [Vibrio harveyi]